ncbi:MAG: alpha/beta hydrolase family protein [Bryobacteraceae bacterium]
MMPSKMLHLRYATSIQAFLCLMPVAQGWQAPGQTILDGALRVSVPFDVVDTLDGAKFKIRVPANWNNTLLVYIQGTKTGAAPPEPRLVPPVLPGSDPPLEDTLLSRGYALAASEISPGDWQVKASLQDTFALTTYFRGRIGDPKRVIVWGTSLGGAASLRLIEDYPRSFDGAIATCAAAAGRSKREDRSLDFNVAYAAAFGWRDDIWGSVDNLRENLNFNRDVYPNVNWPKADGSNRGGWEFIRLVLGQPAEAFWSADPLFSYPGYVLQMFFSTQNVASIQAWASGPVTQNADHRYSLTAGEKAYLAGLGINAEDLLTKMNANTNVQANAHARDYVVRFGDVHGTLSKPVLTLHTTLDAINEVRHENAYRATVEASGCLQYLRQAYVSGVGHCAFTASQLLAALAAMESWLDTGVAPDASAFPEGLGFDNAFVPQPWPY